MADNQSKSSALLSWVGGIAATVIASVLIYHFTRPPATIDVSVDGFITDAVSLKPITGAIVNANLGSAFGSQPTDNEGRYSFNITIPAPTTGESVNVNVLAGGYAHFTAPVPIASTGEAFGEISIVPETAAAVTPAEPGHPVAAPAHIVPRLILRAPENYTKRIDTATLKKN